MLLHNEFVGLHQDGDRLTGPPMGRHFGRGLFRLPFGRPFRSCCSIWRRRLTACACGVLSCYRKCANSNGAHTRKTVRTHQSRDEPFGTAESGPAIGGTHAMKKHPSSGGVESVCARGDAVITLKHTVAVDGDMEAVG